MDHDGALIRAEIETLNVEFWYRVDHRNGEGVADLFCEDGVYSVTGGRNAGRAAIAASYVARAARGPRVSRHVHSNLRLTVESPTRATGVSMLTLWARDGEAPLALVLPVSVSDVHDTYVRDAGGDWRIEHRHITPAFLGDEPAVLPFAPADEKGAVDAV
jgi:SnoaL-like protein